MSLGRDEGVTKLLFEEATNHMLGCAFVGPNAGDLNAEAALAIELGADAEDIGLTVHPHPTLSETVAFAAEMFEGTMTDLIAPKKKEMRRSLRTGKGKERLKREEKMYVDQLQLTTVLLPLLSATFYPQLNSPGKHHGK